MIKTMSSDLISQANEVYERLKVNLEKKSWGEYIIIDPISKEYFINSKLAEASKAAKARFPDRQFFSYRIGFKSAISFSYSHIHITGGEIRG